MTFFQVKSNPFIKKHQSICVLSIKLFYNLCLMELIEEPKREKSRCLGNPLLPFRERADSRDWNLGLAWSLNGNLIKVQWHPFKRAPAVKISPNLEPVYRHGSFMKSLYQVAYCKCASTKEFRAFLPMFSLPVLHEFCKFFTSFSVEFSSQTADLRVKQSMHINLKVSRWWRIYN